MNKWISSSAHQSSSESSINLHANGTYIPKFSALISMGNWGRRNSSLKNKRIFKKCCTSTLPASNKEQYPHFENETGWNEAIINSFDEIFTRALTHEKRARKWYRHTHIYQSLQSFLSPRLSTSEALLVDEAQTSPVLSVARRKAV